MARLRRRCAPSSGSSSRPLDAAETMRGMQPAKLTTGNNDDEAAVRHFVVLVKPATNDVVIHDDGDDAASPYQGRQVIAAVRERLDRGVTVRRLFDNRADLRMVDELRDHPGFTVHYLRQPPLSPEDVHFKIVDRGRGPACRATWTTRTQEVRLLEGPIGGTSEILSGIPARVRPGHEGIGSSSTWLSRWPSTGTATILIRSHRTRSGGPNPEPKFRSDSLVETRHPPRAAFAEGARPG